MLKLRPRLRWKGQSKKLNYSSQQSRLLKNDSHQNMPGAGLDNSTGIQGWHQRGEDSLSCLKQNRDSRLSALRISQQTNQRPDCLLSGVKQITGDKFLPGGIWPV